MKPFSVACMVLVVFTAMLSSCSGDDYLNAIPDNSIALVSIDARKIVSGHDGGDAPDASMLNGLLHADKAEDCGIDMSEKIYIFETAEGNLGVAAKMKSASDMEKWLAGLADAGVCGKTARRGDYCFAVIKDAWMLGFSSTTVMVMGPVIASQHAETMQMMAKYLAQGEEKGIKGTPLYDRLDSMNSSVALVARAKALPEKFAAPFMIGAPKEADASQVMIAASFDMGQGGLMKITGETFSFNESINRGIKDSYAVYRPITDEFMGNVDASALFAMFMNVDGGKYLPLLHADKSLQVLLAGINTVVDMDNIIRSIDGDIVLAVSGYDGDMALVQMGARLKTRGFLGDVDYWKQSVPRGGTISDNGKDSYLYTDGRMNLYFGVSADDRFYAGSTEHNANGILQKSANPLDKEIQEYIKGRRLCMFVNVKALSYGNKTVKTALDLLSPLTGDVNAVLYTIK